VDFNKKLNQNSILTRAVHKTARLTIQRPVSNKGFYV